MSVRSNRPRNSYGPPHGPNTASYRSQGTYMMSQHVMQGNYSNQPRRPLLPAIGTAMMQPPPSMQPIPYPQPGYYNTGSAVLPPQSAMTYPRPFHFSSRYPSPNFSGVPQQVRAQPTSSRSSAHYSSQDNKRERKGVAIVDPDTMEELDVRNIKSSSTLFTPDSSASATPSVVSTAITATTTTTNISSRDMEVRKEFKTKVQETLTTASTISEQTLHAPNAIITNPASSQDNVNRMSVTISETTHASDNQPSSKSDFDVIDLISSSMQSHDDQLELKDNISVSIDDVNTNTKDSKDIKLAPDDQLLIPEALVMATSIVDESVADDVLVPIENENVDKEVDVDDDDFFHVTDVISSIERSNSSNLEFEYEKDDEDVSQIVNGHDIDDPGQSFLRDGRYIYGRDFLLQYQSQHIPPPSSLSSKLEVFWPNGNKTDFKKVGNFGARVQSAKVIHHNPSKSEKVELHKAEVPWMRPTERVKDMDEDAKETADVFRKFQGILNKLTPQKFKDLAEKARELSINTEERLKGCIDKIFTKALEEPNFSVAYAHLCRVLSYIKVEVVYKSESDEESVKEITFRRELLTRCQKEFEKDKKDDESRDEQLKAIENAITEEEKKLKEEQFSEWEDKARKRSLGNIRFIGELFKLKMLSESIMHECIVRLLRSTSDEDSLECFSRLITTTGKELDHQAAKQRMDRYFDRINEIIEKKKISSRIRFMLQDVQELRKNEWIPRRQDTLKTIDQIHQEAHMEEIQEKESIRQSIQSMSGKQFLREDKRRTKDEHMSGGRKGEKSGGGRRDTTPDLSRISALSRKDKTTTTLGPLRPGGWSNKARSQAVTPPPPNDMKMEKEKVTPHKIPTRSSSSGKKKESSVTSRPQLVRRSSATPDTEKSHALKVVKEFMQPQPQAPLKKHSASEEVELKNKLTLEEIKRKSVNILDELVNIGDYKEAVECVNELESSDSLCTFVATVINHSLENDSKMRVMVGTLLALLIKENHLSLEKFQHGLLEVLEIVDDLEVDIPKVWDFLTEIMFQLIKDDSIQLLNYVDLLKEIQIGKKLSQVIAKFLRYYNTATSSSAVSELWSTSNLQWVDLQLSSDQVESFINQENLTFISFTNLTSDLSHSPDDPPYLKDLSLLFASQNSTNDDIVDWIENHIKIEEIKSTTFIKTLARAVVCGSTSGDGNNCIYNEENFRNRLLLLKKWVDEDEKLQGVVLDGVQVGVTLLKHPPSILNKMFMSLYDVEVVSESACVVWRNNGNESCGRGMALQSTKGFFNFLETAEVESDNETVQ